MEKDDDYVSYLLRLQRSTAHGRPTWRVTLQSIQTGEQWNGGLEELLAFLHARFGEEGTREGPSKGGAPRD